MLQDQHYHLQFSDDIVDKPAQDYIPKQTQNL